MIKGTVFYSIFFKYTKTASMLQKRFKALKRALKSKTMAQQSCAEKGAKNETRIKLCKAQL
jgi:hypothetical protein